VIGASLRAAAALLRRTRYEFAGKVILVTGGAGGIGSAFCQVAAARGARLVIADLAGDRAEALAARLPGPAGAHLALAADLTRPDAISAMLDQVSARFGRIDVLVNNSGMTSSERFADRDLASIEREIALNTLSPLYVTRLALPLLRRSADPRVLTTVSLAGIFPQAETPVYCASKFGLRGAMLSIALDLRAEGITVSCVLPSATDTPMLRQEAIDGGNSLQFRDPPQTAEQVAAVMTGLLDRPRLEAYPKKGESWLVRAAMAVPSLLPVVLPLFEGRGRRGEQAYLRALIARGDVVRVDGQLRLADPAVPDPAGAAGPAVAETTAG
jgi:NAD(P)-dependent dehydrogenase (short-subunit alcohol dehydrogenase family)